LASSFVWSNNNASCRGLFLLLYCVKCIWHKMYCFNHF
jgi:hypothetical protein